MTRVRFLIVVLLAGIGALAWWLIGPRRGEAAGLVQLTWRGSQHGTAMLPAEVAWCPVTRMATLLAISNDTGLIVTLMEPDSLAPAPHPVVAPEARDQSPRPGAIVAMRWAGDSGTLQGFRSVSGLVTITKAGQRASGTLEARLRAPVGFDTLVVTASFTGLPVVASAVGCP